MESLISYHGYIIIFNYSKLIFKSQLSDILNISDKIYVKSIYKLSNRRFLVSCANDKIGLIIVDTNKINQKNLLLH